MKFVNRSSSPHSPVHPQEGRPLYTTQDPISSSSLQGRRIKAWMLPIHPTLPFTWAPLILCVCMLGMLFALDTPLFSSTSSIFVLGKKNPKHPPLSGQHILEHTPPLHAKDDAPHILVESLELDAPIVRFEYLARGGLILYDVRGKVLYSPAQSKSTIEIVKEAALEIHIHPYYDDAYIVEPKQLQVLISNADKFVTYLLPASHDSTNLPLQLHYEERTWLLYSGTQCDTTGSLCLSHMYYSINGGMDWHFLLPSNPKGGVPAPACIWARTKDFTLVPKSAVLCMLDQDLVYSEDFFHSPPTIIMRSTTKFAIYGEYLLAMNRQDKDNNNNNSNDSNNNPAQLYVSLDAARFELARFPGNLTTTHAAFTVLPAAHRGALLVDVPVYESERGAVGCLYRSNLLGTRFTAIRTDTYRSMDPKHYGVVDIEELVSIPGFSFANVVANAAEVRGGAVFHRVTRMSLDDGTTWRSLLPPLDSPATVCNPTSNPACRLHLHLYVDRRDNQDVLDARSAPGLFLALGNVGEVLSEYTDAHTYVTRDAGQSWHLAHTGAHQFEFGDHGSVVLLVHDTQPTSSALYSFDDARTFQTIVLANDTFRLRNIYTHPNATKESFVVAGVREKDKKDVLFFIDFTPARQGKCVFDPQNPTTSDFEPWKVSEQCLLGKKTTYFRRKEGKNCAIRDSYELYKHEDTQCQCTKSDFECDYNYVATESGDCVPVTPPPPIACDGATYMVPSGYRKRPASSCAGGLALDQPAAHTCATGHSVFAWILVLLFFVGATYAMMLLYRRLRSAGLEFSIPGADFASRLASDLRYRLQYRPIGGAGSHGTSLLADD